MLLFLLMNSLESRVGRISQVGGLMLEEKYVEKPLSVETNTKL